MSFSILDAFVHRLQSYSKYERVLEAYYSNIETDYARLRTGFVPKPHYALS